MCLTSPITERMHALTERLQSYSYVSYCNPRHTQCIIYHWSVQNWFSDFIHNSYLWCRIFDPVPSRYVPIETSQHLFLNDLWQHNNSHNDIKTLSHDATHWPAKPIKANLYFNKVKQYSLNTRIRTGPFVKGFGYKLIVTGIERHRSRCLRVCWFSPCGGITFVFEYLEFLLP